MTSESPSSPVDPLAIWNWRVSFKATNWKAILPRLVAAGLVALAYQKRFVHVESLLKDFFGIHGQESIWITIAVLAPFAIALISIPLQRHSALSLIRVGVIAAIFGWWSWFEMELIPNVRDVAADAMRAQTMSVALFVSTAILFWAIVERLQREAVIAPEDAGLGRLAAIGTCAVLAAVAWMALAGWKKFMEAQQGDTVLVGFMKGPWPIVALAAPYACIGLGLLTSAGGRRQTFLMIGAAVVAAVAAYDAGFVFREAADRRRQGLLVIDGEQLVTGFWYAIELGLLWMILPLWLMTWGIDWIARMRR